MPSSKLKQVSPVRAEKERRIQDMFNAVAPSYDFLNWLLSFGFDKYWRKNAISFQKMLQKVRTSNLEVGLAM